MEYIYYQTIPDPEDITRTIQEKNKLVLESRVVAFKDDPEVNNPTGDESAYFYGITINGWRETLTTFQPGEEGYQPMNKKEAEKFLEDDITQTLSNYGV